jgi:hypothetical protein
MSNDEMMGGARLSDHKPNVRKVKTAKSLNKNQGRIRKLPKFPKKGKTSEVFLL